MKNIRIFDHDDTLTLFSRWHRELQGAILKAMEEFNTGRQWSAYNTLKDAMLKDADQVKRFLDGDTTGDKDRDKELPQNVISIIRPRDSSR